MALPSFTSLCWISGAAVAGASRLAPDYLSQTLIGTTAILLSYAIFNVFIYPFYLSPLRHLPEPPGAQFPWAHAELLRKQYNSESFRPWNATVKHNGWMRVRVLLNQERVFVLSPAAIKDILVSRSYEFIKPPEFAFLFEKLLGSGVLIAEGDPHKVQRKALLPAFAYRHIKDLYPLFWDKAKKSTDGIIAATKAGSKAESAYDWASRVTLDIIGIAGMGWEFDSIGHPEGELVSVYHELFTNETPHFRLSVIGVPQLPDWTFYLPIPQIVKARKAAQAIQKFARNFIQKKQRASAEEKAKSTDIDILSVAMRSGQFTENELVDQMMTFLAAGHETTASALTWAMYILCHHPHIQLRLRDEIRAHLPPISNPDSTVDAATVDSLPYLNAFCNEVLRCIPSVPTTSRVALKDSVIEGQFIPKGTEMWISPWAMNVDPSLWGEDAGEFNPERWMGKDAANVGGAKSNYAFMTFLHGPRSCIGKDFSKAELKCLVAAWIGRFEVGWAEGKELAMDIEGWVTIKPEHKLPLRFTEVEGW